MLALAVMVTQARFIAKRETTGLEQAMASTSTDPDIVKAPRESGSGREPVAIKVESDILSSQASIGDERSAKTVDQTETQTASLKENLNVKETTPAFEKNESSTTTEKMVSEMELKLKEAETREPHLNGAQVDPVQELKEKVTSADAAMEESSITTTSQLNQNTTNVTNKKSTEAPFKNERLSKEFLSTTTEHILLSEKAHQKDVVITNSPLREAQPEIKDKTTESAASEKSTLPLKPVTIEVPSTTERVVNTTTTRSSDHGRSMQYSSTTEEWSRSPAAVTPMKLMPLPMTSSSSSTTSTSTPSPTTSVSFASNENVIEESTSKSEVRQLPEKRAKFISENSTNAQQLTLPNTAEVWSLAGMKAGTKAPILPQPTCHSLTH
ncbi:GD18771 [Drosophila simulans]|uniref:GD18771 n=1 Tax=Drosophila simulans TaxID=7240 RepID=B4QTN6_DROSI|nr:GD18771 [Drosophila simulans]